MMMMTSAVRRFLGELSTTSSSEMSTTQSFCRDLHVGLDFYCDLHMTLTSFTTLNHAVTLTSWLSGDVVSSSFQVLVVFTRDQSSDDDELLQIDYKQIGINVSAISSTSLCLLISRLVYKESYELTFNRQVSIVTRLMICRLVGQRSRSHRIPGKCRYRPHTLETWWVLIHSLKQC